MLYELDNRIYIKQGNKYFLADVIVKRRTIVVMPTNEYVEELEGATEITFKELKKKIIK
jgi:hypothetical protein